MSIQPHAGNERRSVATFRIRLLFRHPTIDPALITQALGVEPTTQARVGDRVRPARDGSLRHGIERESAWGLSAEYRDAYRDTDPNLNERLTSFLEPLMPHAAVVRKLAAESTLANVDLEFPGQYHFGGELSPNVLRKVYNLGLTLGIEVFPDSAT